MGLQLPFGSSFHASISVPVELQEEARVDERKIEAGTLALHLRPILDLPCVKFIVKFFTIFAPSYQPTRRRQSQRQRQRHSAIKTTATRDSNSVTVAVCCISLTLSFLTRRIWK